MNEKGFSLIELLVSLIIIAIIASVAFPVSRIGFVRELEGDLKYYLRSIRDGIDRYRDEEGSYPVSLKEMVDKYYIRRVPQEPFGKKWQYRNSTGGDWEDFESYGDQYRAKTGDDIFDVRTSNNDLSITGEKYSSW
ncbi:MAG: prepilin-type N-terminal cleavage/methylation domain-containing protein [Candidatus Muiribacteriota bacterium]